MDACGCDDFFAIFDGPTAERDRERYRRAGPDATTRMLIEMIRPYGVAGVTVLDVGGGIGVIDQELLKAGAGHAVLVEAAPAFLAVARQKARATNLLDRLELIDGDFTRRAAEIDSADIVTLDRVVCCYPDAEALVGLSAARARRVYGLVLPRDRWLHRLAVRLLNVGFRLRRKQYRSFVHSNERIDRLVAAAGLRPRSERETFFWRVVVYARDGGGPGLGSTVRPLDVG